MDKKESTKKVKINDEDGEDIKSNELEVNYNCSDYGILNSNFDYLISSKEDGRIVSPLSTERNIYYGS